MRLSVDQVLRVLAKRYGVAVDDPMKGRRGKDNGPRKIGMYLAKELCEMKLTKIAGQFGAGAMAWWVGPVTESRQGCGADAKFRERLSSIREFVNKRPHYTFLRSSRICTPNSTP